MTLFFWILFSHGMLCCNEKKNEWKKEREKRPELNIIKALTMIFNIEQQIKTLKHTTTLVKRPTRKKRDLKKENRFY